MLRWNCWRRPSCGAERSMAVLCDLYSTSYLLEAERCTHSMEHLIDRSVKTPALREVVGVRRVDRQYPGRVPLLGRMTQNREGRAADSGGRGARDHPLPHRGRRVGQRIPRLFGAVRAGAAGGVQLHLCLPLSQPVFATPTAGGIEVRFAVEFRYMALRSEPITGISAARLDPDFPEVPGPPALHRAADGRTGRAAVGHCKMLWDHHGRDLPGQCTGGRAGSRRAASSDPPETCLMETAAAAAQAMGCGGGVPGAGV